MSEIAPNTYRLSKKVSPRIWRKMLEIGREQDINRGGYLDARSGCLNLWCGPFDRPHGWPDDLPITAGALAYPREYVAGLHVEWPEGNAPFWYSNQPCLTLICRVSVYAHADWIRRYRREEWRDRFSYNDDAILRVPGDLEWCERHIVPLLREAGHRFQSEDTVRRAYARVN